MPTFHTEQDSANERTVASMIEAAWGCTVHSFGAMYPIDWYAQRGDRLIGVLELKCRNRLAAEFSTVFVSVRKWLALSFAGIGLHVPAILVVGFSDCVLWLPVDVIDARRHRVTGRPPRPGSAHDIEPVIEVPLGQFRLLRLPRDNDSRTADNIIEGRFRVVRCGPKESNRAELTSCPQSTPPLAAP